MVANASEDYLPYRWEIIAERYLRLLLSLTGKKDEVPTPAVKDEVPTPAVKDEVPTPAVSSRM
jgi:hypothetical protein